MLDRANWLRWAAVPAVGGLALFGVWWAISASGMVGPTLIASPGEVAQRLLLAFSADASPYERLHEHVLATLGRSLEGWFVGMGIGTVLGLLMGRSRLGFNLSAPSVEFIRAIPPILAFPLLLVAFNYSREAYVGTIIFGCAPIVAIAVAQGVRMIAQERIEVFRVHQQNPATRILAGAMEIVPSISLAARLTFSFAIIIAVVTEMVFTPRSGFGIGSIAREAEVAFDTPAFYAAVLLTGSIGYLGNLLLRWLEGRFGPGTIERL